MVKSVTVHVIHMQTPIIIDSSDSENSESPHSPALVAVVKIEETYKSPVKISFREPIQVRS